MFAAVRFERLGSGRLRYDRVMKRCVIVFLLAAVACGGESTKTPTAGGKRPNNRDASVRQDQDAGPDAGDAPQTGPVLEFTSPTAAVLPSDESVLVESTVTVRCKATQRDGGARVDGSSVKITMDKPNPMSATDRVTAPVDARPNDEYEAKFDVSAMPNGEVRFHCEAKDLASMAQSSSLTLKTLLDLGPAIQVFKPTNMGTYARLQPVPIEFEVTPSPIAEGDEMAAVKDVKLVISGMPIAIAEASGEPGVYRTTVDFDDATLFTVKPTSAEISITATNARAPTAATRSVRYDIGIDGDGPVIKVDAPTYNSIVHGEVTFKVNVVDPSGLKPNSLRALLKAAEKMNKSDIVIDQWEGTAPNFTQKFDTRSFHAEVNQLTIEVSASDSVGNSKTISHLLYLDNVPPLLGLDPPKIREFRERNTNEWVCSAEFDPVGDDALDDGEVSLAAGLFRVLIEDQTNRAPGANFAYYSGVKRDDVYLFAQGDPAEGLLIDTNEDGICDEINSDLGAKSPTRVQLRDLTPRGAPWYAKAPTFTTTVPYYGYTCTQDPTGADNAPQPLCGATEMFRVVPGRGEDKPPAVYSLSPTNAATGPCEGQTWEVGNIVGEGWACLAVRASDNIGNVGISPPLRVCFNDGIGPAPDCLAGLSDPNIPTCLKNCTIQNSQIYPGGMIWRQR